MSAGQLRRRIAAVVASATLAMLVLAPASALAHPLGNFTANTAAALTVRSDAIVVDYVLDLAEVPALREQQRVREGGEVADAARAQLGASRCAELAAGIVLDVGPRSLDVAVTASDAIFTPGEAGLPTLRVECRFEANWELAAQRSLTFVDTNTADRIGWREVTAVGDGTTLVASDVPTTSLTDRLRSYPEDRLRSPLDVRSAALTVAPGGPRLDGSDGGAPGSSGDEGFFERISATYTGLVAERELTFGFGLFALLLSLVLGAMHALAPGHGKTVMAAYVVGQRGTTRQALLIGLTVAITHTLGVLGLGIAISASETLAPESLYPWLGGISGLLLVAIGVGLLRRSVDAGRSLAAVAERGVDVEVHAPAPAPAFAGAHAAGAAPLAAPHAEHDHDHGQTHDHDHDRGHHEHAPALREVAHTHGGSTHVHVVPGDEPITWRSLITLGVAGGLVPSPSALVVLLGAVALGRAWFGVGLVVAYGLGLAITLVVGGLLLVRLRDRAEGWIARSGRFRNATLARWLPVVTASLVVLGGLAVVARSILIV